MPEFGTQVYWHDIPDCPPPWRTAEEHAKTWRISRRTTAPVSDPRDVLVLPRAELVARRYYGRIRRPRRHRHWGIVLEPHLSPLHGVNLVMEELRAAPVTAAEAREAVDAVCREYNAMTQQQRRWTQSQGFSQGAVKAELLTQQSNAAAVDLREAPLHEVFKIFCAARGLKVTTFTKAERRLKGRFGVADVLPQRRVIMAFDRSKPRFVFARAVTAGNKGNGTSSDACFLQLFAPTSNPVPWRRLIHGVMPHLPPGECVVVAVQRHQREGSNDDSADCVSQRGEEHTENELVLGGDETDDDDVKGVTDLWAQQQEQQQRGGEKRRAGQKCLRGKNKDEDDSDTSEDSCNSYETVSSLRSDVVRRRKILGPDPIFTAEDKLQDDPLFDTPIAVLRKMPRAAFGVHDWIQRLIEPRVRKSLYAIH